MARTALVTLLLSSTAILAYVGYRALDLVVVPQEAPVAAPSVELVEVLPEFTLENVAGEPQSIGSWPGKALLVNFWATWCAPCLREIPLLVEYQEANDDLSLQVVGIAVDQADPVRALMNNVEFNYPVLIGQADAMDAAAAFGVEFFGLPFSVFTDTEGNVLGVHSGELHREDLDELMSVLSDLAAGRSTPANARSQFSGLR
ncbi:MAG: TlpA family protein disulfide reductase [Candidatus Rariloculaceae bacterium]